MSWKIVAHSFALLFRNLAQALRVSIGPLLLALLVIWVVALVLGVTPQMVVFGAATGRMPLVALIVLSLGIIAVIFASAWVAIAWHRFILLEEYPGLLPPVKGARVAAYAGRSILLFLLLLLVMFPISAIAGQMVGMLGLAQFQIVQIAFTFGIATLFTFFWLRIAIVLPATALDHSYSLSQGWNAGGSLSKEILGASAIVVALNMVVSLITGMLPLGPWPGLIVQLVISWVTAMVGSSLLTTLYGILVEGRRLP